MAKENEVSCREPCRSFVLWMQRAAFDAGTSHVRGPLFKEPVGLVSKGRHGAYGLVILHFPHFRDVGDPGNQSRLIADVIAELAGQLGHTLAKVLCACQPWLSTAALSAGAGTDGGEQTIHSEPAAGRCPPRV